MLENSRDFHELFPPSSEETPTTGNETNSSKKSRSHYLANRFYSFLKAIPEFMSAVRDNNSIETMTYI
jgi:hypothetical protein